MYSRECRTPPQQQLQEVKDDAEEEEGSAQRESSDEGAGEQQLGTYELYPSLLRPSADGADKGADVSIIRVLDELPAEESAHLANKGKRSKAAAGGSGSSRRRGGSCPIGSAAFKLHFGYLKEGTMQVEVSLRSSKANVFIAATARKTVDQTCSSMSKDASGCSCCATARVGAVRGQTLQL
jgi:hypothetical protein